MKEALCANFPMTSNPDADAYLNILADMYRLSEDSHVPERMVSYVFLRSHALEKGASIRQSLPASCAGIPHGVVDSHRYILLGECFFQLIFRFAHSTSGKWELFVSANKLEVDLYTNNASGGEKERVNESKREIDADKDATEGDDVIMDDEPQAGDTLGGGPNDKCLQFPSKCMVFPSMSMKPDMLTGLVGLAEVLR